MGTTYRCPEGHDSTASDWCDVCGSPIDNAEADPTPSPAAAGPAPPLLVPPAGAATKVCPNCAAPNPADAAFCEDCGVDFATGQLPASSAAPNPLDLATPVPAPSSPPSVVAEWVAEVWVDPDWYAVSGDHDEACPSAGMPVIVPLPAPTALIGRHSASRNIHPEIDGGTDSSISRRHASLTRDGSRWFVEDLQSTNGTYIGKAGDPPPTQPIAPTQRVELGDHDRVYVGSWTRIVLRKATPDDRGG